MRQLLTVIFLSTFFVTFSQDNVKTNGLYYKISLAGTLTTNDEYTLDPNDDTGSFFQPSAFFINNTIGYQFDNRSSFDLNAEYDRYTRQNLNFFPVFLGLNYNILDFDDVVFVRAGYGKLVDLGKSFESGNMYKFGIGYRAFDDNFKNSWLVGLDFSRKRFGYRQEEKLTSVSVFFEFMLF